MPTATIRTARAREILDSRGNPTVEVEVDPGRRHARPGRRPQRGQHRGPRGRRAARRRQEALPRQGRPQGRRERQRRRSPRPLVGHDAVDQVGIDHAMLAARRHAQQGQARRQRHPRRVAGRRPRRRRRPPGCRCTATSAATNAKVPARADDEHPQRRQARRQHRRLPGIHDHAARRPDLPRGPADGGRGLPQPQEGAPRQGPEHRRRRRGRVRPEPRQQPTRPSRCIATAVEKAGYKLGDQVVFALDPATHRAVRRGQAAGQDGLLLLQERPEQDHLVRRDDRPAGSGCCASARSARSRTGWPRTTGTAGRS